MLRRRIKSGKWRDFVGFCFTWTVRAEPGTPQSGGVYCLPVSSRGDASVNVESLALDLLRLGLC